LFSLFRILIVDSCEFSQVIEEKMHLEGLEDQAKLQMSPKMTQDRQNPLPKSKYKEIKMRRSGKPPDNHYKWPPRAVVAATARTWWKPRLWWPKILWLRRFILRGCSSSHAICRFCLRICLFKSMYLAAKTQPIHSHTIVLSSQLALE